MAMNGRIRRRGGLVEASGIGLRIAEFAVFFSNRPNPSPLIVA